MLLLIQINWDGWLFSLSMCPTTVKAKNDLAFSALISLQVSPGCHAPLQQVGAARQGRRSPVPSDAAALLDSCSRRRKKGRVLGLAQRQPVVSPGHGAGHGRGLGARVAGGRLLETHHEVITRRSCSTVVECTLHDTEVVGSNPIRCWALLSIISSSLIQLLCRGAALPALLILL